MEERHHQREDSEFGTDSDATPQIALPQELPAEPPATPGPPSLPPPLPPSIIAATPTAQPAEPLAQPRSGPTAWLWFSSIFVLLNLAVLGFMEFVFAIYALFTLAGVSGLPDWFEKCVNALNDLLVWPRFGMFFCLILWQGCAFGSLIRLYGAGRLQHGRGCGFWWITPVANLFMPFHCLRELHWASRQQRAVTDRKVSAGILAWLILVGTILNLMITIADRLVTVLGTTSTDPAFSETSTLATSINLASNAVGLLVTCFLGLFILRNLIHQIRLCRAWTSNPPATDPVVVPPAAHAFPIAQP